MMYRDHGPADREGVHQKQTGEAHTVVGVIVRTAPKVSPLGVPQHIFMHLFCAIYFTYFGQASGCPWLHQAVIWLH
jgi:hypothetical protein